MRLAPRSHDWPEALRQAFLWLMLAFVLGVVVLWFLVAFVLFTGQWS